MTLDRNKKIVAVAALTLFTAASAQAQTGDDRRNRDRQPQPVPGNRSAPPGWMFTPFPVNGARPNPPAVPAGGPSTVKPLNGPAAGIDHINGGTTVIHQSGYPYYPGYPAYPYGGAGTSVIVNQNPVTYPVGNWGAGTFGYQSTPPTVTVVRTSPTGRTRMSTYSGFAFPGYTTAFTSGQTVLSPFGAYLGCPRYVSSRYVILGAPYPYLNGRDTNIVISPWAENDPYMVANASRGRSLGTALRDLSRFWESGNAAGLRRRIQPDIPVAVFDGGSLVYSLRRVDFLALAADASDQIQTSSFRFTDVRERSDGLVNAYATHTYRSRDDGTTRTVQVRYTLVYVDGDWYLSATSISPGAS